MKRVLTMDDIRKGMYVTVLQGKIEQKVIPTLNGPRIVDKENDYWNGKILEVTAVDMPYIVVKLHTNMSCSTYSLDVRIVQFMLLSPEYIKACCPDIKISKDLFWKDIKDDSIKNVNTTIEEIFKDL